MLGPNLVAVVPARVLVCMFEAAGAAVQSGPDRDECSDDRRRRRPLQKMAAAGRRVAKWTAFAFSKINSAAASQWQTVPKAPGREERNDERVQIGARKREKRPVGGPAFRERDNRQLASETPDSNSKLNFFDCRNKLCTAGRRTYIGSYMYDCFNRMISQLVVRFGFLRLCTVAPVIFVNARGETPQSHSRIRNTA